MKAVVSFADKSGNYQRAQERLSESLDIVGFDGRKLLYTSCEQVESPTHQEVPYAFKAYSIQKAIDDGAELILWCDSVIVATSSIDPVFEHIEKEGYLFFDNIGFTIGDYTNDKCLEIFGMSREESYRHPMVMACAFGINVNHPEGKEFITRYIEAASNGSYLGSWKDHRHDQSVASIIIAQMGLKVTKGQDTFFAYEEHKTKMKISNTVCLWSRGI